VIVFTLSHAKNVIKADIASQSDPYVKVIVYDDILRQDVVRSTRHVNNTDKPVWNEILHFGFDSAPKSAIIQLWDKDTFTSDDLLGQVEVDLAKYWDSKR
jgi:stromal membrane-associated protein